MRKLKNSKVVTSEEIVKIEIDHIAKATMITVAEGYEKNGQFIPIEASQKVYTMQNTIGFKSQKAYWAEIDKQRSPHFQVFGLRWIAKTEGVRIKYIRINECPAKISVAKPLITISVVPQITTNEEIINLVKDSSDAQTLVYIPEILDPNAIVIGPVNETELN